MSDDPGWSIPEQVLTSEFPSHRDRDFLERVFGTPPAVYRRRLEAIGFAGLGRVLDAGSGFGQWAMALAELNDGVVALDYSAFRVGVADQIAAASCLSVDGMVGSLNRLPLADQSVDGVFSYAAIFAVDFRVALAEMARVLRPGGLLYFSTSSIGWYLHNAVRGHNDSADFSSRRAALATMRASAHFYTRGVDPPPEVGLVIPKFVARRAVVAAGFGHVRIAAEGTLGPPVPPGRPFYQPTYLGLPGVFEVLAVREPR